MPQMPQMQQQQMPQMSQFMPQRTQMPDVQQFMPGNMQSQMQQYMPNGKSGMQSNNDFFNNLMSQMKNRTPSFQAPEGNNMGMGRQDIDAQSGGGQGASKTSNKLGSLSQKYESSGNPAVIARTKGDIGGASYGTYQLTTASGHAQKFASSFGGSLKGKRAGTAAFDAAWKAEAKKNPEAFANAQHKYIENNHYAPAANNIKKRTGFDVSKMPKAVQDAVWSIGVQHGAGGAASIFKNAGVTNKMSPEQVLRKVYGERMKTHIYFKSSPKSIQNSVKKRFQSELNDALKML